MFKKILRFIVSLFMFVVVVLMSVALCVGSVFAFDYLNSEAAFSRWRTLPEPPSDLAEILVADYSTIWIETVDGSIYSMYLICPYMFSDCTITEWIKSNLDVVELPTDAPDDGIEIDYGSTCKFLDVFDLEFLREPSGNVIECVRLVSSNPSGVSSTYFARTDNDKILYLTNSPVLGEFDFLFVLFIMLFVGLLLGVLLYILFYNKILKR